MRCKATYAYACPQTYGVVVYGCTRERVSLYGEYSGKIFDTDLSAVAATYIYRRLPGLGSRVAVTCASWVICLVAALAASW